MWCFIFDIRICKLIYICFCNFKMMRPLFVAHLLFSIMQLSDVHYPVAHRSARTGAPPARGRPVRMPGFRLSLAYTGSTLVLLVLLPFSALFARATALSGAQLWSILSSPRVVAAFELSFGAAILSAGINALLGGLTAWVLVRYRFPGKRWLSAFVDLPLALPTAVAGIALATVCGPQGWIGQWFTAWDIKLAFSPVGILIAMIFVGLPFMVRTLQPMFENLDHELEEVALTLGANSIQVVRRVILPALWPGILTGFSLSFARAVGEYGSIIFIAGNLPMVSEIVPLLIVTRLEQYDYSGAAAIATVTLGLSFFVLWAIHTVRERTVRGVTHGGRDAGFV